MAGKKISQLTALSEELVAGDLLEIENLSQAAGSKSEKATFKQLQGLYINERSSVPDDIEVDDIGGIVEINAAASTAMVLPVRSTTGTRGQITHIVNLTSNNQAISQNPAEAGNVILNGSGSAVSSFTMMSYSSARIYDNGSNWIVL